MPQPEVPIKNLPDAVLHGVADYVRLFGMSIGLAPEDRDGVSGTCSATLVDLNGRRGFLTARHVWQRFCESRERIFFMVNNRGYEVERGLFGQPVVPPVCGKYVDYDEGIPDIAFVPLADPVANDLASRSKAFYHLAQRKLDADLYDDRGYWVVVGTPLALARSTPEAARVGSLVYSTDIQRIEIAHGWDFISVNLNLGSNPEIPESYHGVSGGGLWRIRIYRTPAGEIFTDPSKDIILSGVIFLQTPMDPRRLIAHGPRSIYEQLCRTTA